MEKRYVIHVPAEDLDIIKKDNKYEKEKAINNQIDNYIDNISDKIAELEKFADFALGFTHTISKNGFTINKDFNVEIAGDGIYSGAMIGAPAVANAHDIMLGIANENQYDIPVGGIINTIDDGFHYIGANKDDDAIHDLGRIDFPCYIGDAHGPHGIYIPLNSCALAHAPLLVDIEKSNLAKLTDGSIDIDDCIRSLPSDEDE